MNYDLLKTFTGTTLIAVLGFIVAYQFVDPAPPSTIRIATGSEKGAYHLFAGRYREFLASEEITLELIPSRGSVENNQLLASGQADIAFIQGGTGDKGSALLSLGSLYFEPLWVFYRQAAPTGRLDAFTGKRLSIGQPGSGTRAVMEQLLSENLITAENSSWLDLDSEQAVEGLLNGELDMAAFVASPQAPLVQQLLSESDIRLMNFERAAAYARRYQFLSVLELPEGVLNMSRNLPRESIRLLAPTANLVAGENLHPALIDLLLQAAQHVHADGGLFETANQFPAPEYLVYPLHTEAKRFYQSGPPFLQRLLPFWAASLVDRLKVMLLPLIALLIPLLKLMPPLYQWRMRSRIYRWYRELESIDLAIEEDELAGAELASELDRIEQEVLRVQVPLSFAVELYDLRMHLALVRKRLHIRTGVS